MSKKLPKENLKKISGGVTGAQLKKPGILPSKGGKELDADLDTGKAPAKKGGIKNFSCSAEC